MGSVGMGACLGMIADMTMLAERGAAFREALRLNWKEATGRAYSLAGRVFSGEAQSIGAVCDDRRHRADAVGGVA